MRSARILFTDNDLLTHPLVDDGAGGGVVDAEEVEVQVLRAGLGEQTAVTGYQCRTEDEVLAAVARVRPHAMVVQYAPITARVLDAAVDCRIISRLGIGVDMIDLDAAAARGVIVRNVPDYCVEEVATHAFAGAMALWRRLPQYDQEVRIAGEWAAARSAGRIGRLSQACVGLIGCGRIGRMVARGFQAWGAQVIVVDPGPVVDEYPRVDLATLAERADIISLHAPLTAQTAHIVNTQFCDSLRRSPILVNTSRGGLIDESALIAALHSGQIAGAALDVFEVEPLSADSPLRTMPQVVLTPHAAWVSRDALPDLRRRVAESIVAVLDA